MPFPGSPKQNARKAELTENREKEFQKVDVDERNPTAEGPVEIDVDAYDAQRDQSVHRSDHGVGAGDEGWGLRGQALRWEPYHLTPWNPWSNENPPPKYRLGKKHVFWKRNFG